MTHTLTDEEYQQFKALLKETLDQGGSGGGDGAKPVHVTFVLDRSGSMQSIQQDVIGGFGAFIKEQQGLTGKCSLTMYQFDTGGFDCLYDGVDIQNVKLPLEFAPRGGTPLYDAIGRSIANTQMRVEKNEGVENQVFVIFTDGQENSSKEYTKEKIFDLINAKQALGWTFAYLGANQDAYVEGGKVGTFAGSTQNFTSDSAGTAAAFASTSSSLLSYRSQSLAGATPDNSSFYVNKDAEEAMKKRS